MEIRITDAAVETANNIRCNSLHSEAGNFEGYNVLFFCMDEACWVGSQPVLLPDGTYKTLGEIVNKKLSIDVMSYNFKTKKMEPKKVTNWFRYEKPKESLLRVYFDSNKLNRPRVITGTKNHHIFTPSGKVRRLDELCVGSKVYSTGVFLSERQKHILYGSLLGDASISAHGNLQFVHGEKQIDYLNFKRHTFKSLYTGVRSVNKSGYAPQNNIFRDTFKKTDEMMSIRDMFYSAGSKKITKEITSKLTLESLAFWYLDDGSLLKGYSEYTSKKTGKVSKYVRNLVRFCCPAYTKAEVLLLLSVFESFGFSAGLIHNTKYKNNNNSGFDICLTKHSSINFLKKISKYIPNSMKYKSLSPEKCAYSPLDDSKKFSVETVKKIEIIKGRDSLGRGTPSYVYDIEVEDNHNYFASNILVSNSEFEDKFETVRSGDEIINVGKAELIYNTLLTSAVSRKLPWLGVIISFPRRVDDFTIRMYEEAIKNPDGIAIGVRGCTWDFNPRYDGEETYRFETWDVPISFKTHFENDPSNSRMKFCTVPPIILNRFFYNDERIMAAIDEDIPPLLDVMDDILEIGDANGKKVKYKIKRILSSSAAVDRRRAYAIHVDLSISGDSTTVVIGHGEPCDIKSTFISEGGDQELKILHTRVVIDQIFIWEPDLKQRAVVSHINVDEIIESLTGLTGCRYISYDQYQSQYVLEKAARNGMESEKHNINTKDYVLFRNMLWAGAISYPKNPKLLFEIQRIIWDGKKPDHLPIFSKDVVDSVIGVSRAIAAGLAKPQNDMIFTFMPDSIFSGILPGEGSNGLPQLPQEALGNTYIPLENTDDAPPKDVSWFL